VSHRCVRERERERGGTRSRHTGLRQVIDDEAVLALRVAILDADDARVAFAHLGARDDRVRREELAKALARAIVGEHDGDIVGDRAKALEEHRHRRRQQRDEPTPPPRRRESSICVPSRSGSGRARTYVSEK